MELVVILKIYRKKENLGQFSTINDMKMFIEIIQSVRDVHQETPELCIE